MVIVTITCYHLLFVVQVVQQMASGWQMVAEHLSESPNCVFYLLFDAKEFLFAKNLVDMSEDLDTELKQVQAISFLSWCFCLVKCIELY